MLGELSLLFYISNAWQVAPALSGLDVTGLQYNISNESNGWNQELRGCTIKPQSLDLAEYQAAFSRAFDT